MLIFNQRFFALLIGTCISVSSCTVRSTDGESENIIKVGDAALTRAEWNKHLEQSTGRYKEKYHTVPGIDSIKIEQSKFIDYGYVLAGAYAKGYDKSPDIEKKVLEISKYMMCQRNGPLFKTLYNLKGNQNTDIGYLSAKKIILSVIKFKSHELMVKLFSGDTLSKTLEDFNKNAQKLKLHKDVEVISDTIPFPSERYLLLQDQILKLADGETSSPLKDEFTGEVYLFNKLKTVPTVNDHIQPQKIAEYLKYLNEEKFYRQTANKYLSVSDYKIDTSFFHVFLKKLTYGPNITIVKSSVSGFLGLQILSYRVNHEIKNVSCENMIDYYNNDLPLRRRLSSGEQFVILLKEMIINDIGYAAALQLGLTEKSDFKVSQRNFRNITIAEAFKKNNLFVDVQVNERDIFNFYNQHKNAMTVPSDFQVSQFVFNNPTTARTGLQDLQRISAQPSLANKDLEAIKGLKSFTLKFNIPYNSKLYETRIIDELVKMPPFTLTHPFIHGKDIVVIRKEKSGAPRIKTYDEVRSKIEYQMLQNLRYIALEKYLKAAKERFTLINNFTDQDLKIPAQGQ